MIDLFWLVLALTFTAVSSFMAVLFIKEYRSHRNLEAEVRFLKYRLNNHKRYIGHFFRYLEWGPPEEMPDGRYKLTQEQFHILMNEHPSKPTQLKPKKSSSKSKPQHKVVLY